MDKQKRAMLKKEYNEVCIQREQVWNEASKAYEKRGIWTRGYAMLRLTMQCYAIVSQLRSVPQMRLEEENMAVFDKMCQSK